MVFSEAFPSELPSFVKTLERMHPGIGELGAADSLHSLLKS